MFTGIIQDIGTVRSIDKKDGDWRVEIETALDLSTVPIGASISCSGCCLTVVQKGTTSFAVDVSRETLERTGIASWEPGTKVNIEPSLRLGDELGGHFVFGHVDAQAEIRDIKPSGDSRVFTITYKGGLIAPKGSVSLDGVSLTVNEATSEHFTVNIIPHTLAHTTLGERIVGDRVNLEIDMLARYVVQAMRSAA